MKTILINGMIIISLFGCKKNVQQIDSPETPAEKTWKVTTVAGSEPGIADGPLATAKFHFPTDVIVRPEGSLYVSDLVNSVIRKVAIGQVSTFTGNNGFGIVDGPAAIAQFKDPINITADAGGNLFTTDGSDPRIRKITPAGNVVVFAGSATEGYLDGNPADAQFKSGNSIVADAHGNIYVSDGLNHRIRRVSASGQVSTFAGTGEHGYKDGDASSAQFYFPGAITIDKLGNLYVMDRTNLRIRKITPTGVVSTIAGSGLAGDSDGNANEASFSHEMHDIVVDQKGNLFVIDDQRIRKISSEGYVTTIAGSVAGFRDGNGRDALFHIPFGLDIDAQGNLYVADLFNNRIRKISFE